MNWLEYIQMFTGLFAILNPISAVPLYLTFTENMADGAHEDCAKGFLMVSSSPLTRSSYHAGDDFAEMKTARDAQLSNTNEH